MGPLIISQFVVCGTCLAIGLLHLALYARLPKRKADLFFSLMCFLSAAGAFLEALTYRAVDLQTYNSLYKLQVSVQGCLWIAMVWFIALMTDSTRRWVIKTVTAAYGLAVLINIISPYGLLYSTIDTLNSVRLPWGEQLFFAAGPSNPWRIIADIAWLILIYMVIDSCIQLSRRGERRRALFIGTSLLLCLGPAYLHASLIDMGILSPPFLISYAFLALILVMSSYLVGEVVQASLLARTVTANEHRWRSLLENVNLLVVGVDNSECINFVNPHFCKVSGYSADEIMGERINALFPQKESEDPRIKSASAMAAEIRTHTHRELATKDGRHRHVDWYHTILRDADGQIIGTLSIGQDVTELKQTEIDRDSAIQKLETLKAQLEEENIFLKEEIANHLGFKEIVGRSNAIYYVLEKVQQVARTDATVLIQGETGVGKELIARAIHRTSTRSTKPFVNVNCTTLPANLVESELFGHERGAFTGADRLRKGRFEMADGGTIFLDEISELPIDLQSKLLRILQEGQFERIGRSETLSADVRVIAATNRNLKEEVAAGRFRPDLFYRLNVYPITVPPLRSRIDDVPLLVQHFVPEFAARIGKKIEQIPPRFMAELQGYDWPGNIRELQNLLERAVITSPDSVLRLPEALVSESSPNRTSADSAIQLIDLQSVERRHILGVLKAVNWRISGPKGAAKILGLNPSTLRFRMKKLEIQKNS
jgi:PAS domain S-box-containing protein